LGDYTVRARVLIPYGACVGTAIGALGGAMSQETVVAGAAVLAAVLIVAALWWRRFRWLGGDSPAHRFATSPTEERYRAAFERRKAEYKASREEPPPAAWPAAVEPAAAGPAVAALSHRARHRYELGSDHWDALVSQLRAELADDPVVGLTVALTIVEDVLADLSWEVGFWAAEAGVGPERFAEMTVQERFAAALWSGRPDPYQSAGGHHPRIHLVAAARALADLAGRDPERAVERDVAGRIEDLLEHWFGYAESTYRLEDLDIIVARSLVEAYRSVVGAVGERPFPPFLSGVIDRKVARRSVNLRNKTHRRTGDLVPVFRPGGRVSFARLAARARV
jgi:hypothetical protein